MKRRFWVLLLLLFLGLLVNCEKTIPFPAELIGTWETDVPRYEDRFIEISNMQLIFGTGDALPDVLFVQKVKKNQKDTLIEWVFSCQNSEGDPIEIVLFYKTGTNGNQLTLKNNEHILWIKVQA